MDIVYEYDEGLVSCLVPAAYILSYQLMNGSSCVGWFLANWVKHWVCHSTRRQPLLQAHLMRSRDRTETESRITKMF